MDNSKVNVVEIPVPKVEDSPIDHPAKIAREGNRWRVVVELTWDVIPDDVRVKYQGDAPVDFASRALDRVRPALNSIVGKEEAFAHFHILEMPTRCTEF
jgi:hypothetical protein